MRKQLEDIIKEYEAIHDKGCSWLRDSLSLDLSDDERASAPYAAAVLGMVGSDLAITYGHADELGCKDSVDEGILPLYVAMGILQDRIDIDAWGDEWCDALRLMESRQMARLHGRHELGGLLWEDFLAELEPRHRTSEFTGICLRFMNQSLRRLLCPSWECSAQAMMPIALSLRERRSTITTGINDRIKEILGMDFGLASALSDEEMTALDGCSFLGLQAETLNIEDPRADDEEIRENLITYLGEMASRIMEAPWHGSIMKAHRWLGR